MQKAPDILEWSSLDTLREPLVSTTATSGSLDLDYDLTATPAAAPRTPPPLTTRFRKMVQRHATSTTPAVANFIDGVVLFVLSREWHELLSVHVMHLHPLPFCSMDSANLPCTLEASSAHQFGFAFGLLLLAVVVQQTLSPSAAARAVGGSVRENSCEARWPSLSIVPPMVSMVVGWAFGFAAVQWLNEVDGGSHLPSAPLASWAHQHPGAANLVLSLAAAVACSLLITACRPSTAVPSLGAALQRALCCGSGCPASFHSACLHEACGMRGWAQALLDSAEGVWRLCARALSVMVMMLWQNTIGALLVDGTGQAQQQGPLFVRMMLFWAVAITTAGSLLSLQMIRARSSFVVIVTPLSSYPSPWVTISDLMLALGLTAAAIGWLVVARPAGANGSGVGVAGLLFAPTPTKVDHEVGEPVGEPDLDTPRVSPPPAADDRGVVEIEYLTRASSFFVGWAWVVWVQDVETLVARSWRIFLFRDAWSYAGEFAFCAFFGPGFTLLLVRGHRWAGTSLRVDDGPGSRHVWQSLLASVGLDEEEQRLSKIATPRHQEGAASATATEGPASSATDAADADEEPESAPQENQRSPSDGLMARAVRALDFGGKKPQAT